MEMVNECYLLLLLMMSVFGLIGIIFLGIVVALNSKEKRNKASCTQLVIATVVDMQHRAIGASALTDADEVRMMSWFPVYEYIVNGDLFMKREFVGTSKPVVSLGQKVSLYVNPHHPDEFYCPEDKTSLVRKVFTWVGIVCVSITLILGVVLYII